ncbi:hypothetical protein [Streptomyces sp.]|uniref:COG4315 family predicted lipoprotein n=1 Tax=Streptomyces sp. TaxID=1931 RepID=UPI002F40933C
MFPHTTSRPLAALAVAVAAGLTAVACSSSSDTSTSGSSSPSTSASTVITTHRTNTLGEVYADSTGHTAYTADQEAGGRITCTGGCLVVWHPVAGGGGSSASPHAAHFGTVKRPDNGQIQVTYAGKPVYTFAQDGKPGDTNGDNVMDSFGGHSFTWHALRVSPSGSTSPSSPSTSGGGGYGY